ncbi:bifunctional DNA primase/polymerase [Aciditerrimonas ferrireducens]|uniref:Bifunctional DNA primase/polymerase n=1 Tax=Aciditerrimonas ferrireducens TaxID=667306 RepID=A0ABV6BZS9_9ACTN
MQQELTGSHAAALNHRPPRLAALWYTTLGWAVLPMSRTHDGECRCPKGSACPCAGPHPLVPTGPGAPTTNSATVRAWWATWPWAQVGVATGAPSALLVLETSHDHDPELPPTWTMSAGTRSWRFYHHPPTRGLPRPALPDACTVHGEGRVVMVPPALIDGARARWLPGPQQLATLPTPAR